MRRHSEALAGAVAAATHEMSSAEAGMVALTSFSPTVAGALDKHDVYLDFCIAEETTNVSISSAGAVPKDEAEVTHLGRGGGGGGGGGGDGGVGGGGGSIGTAAALRQMCKERLTRDAAAAKMAMRCGSVDSAGHVVRLHP